MNKDAYTEKAWSYLVALCNVRPNRRTGSAGNRQAVDFFANVVGGFGYEVDATPFACLDHVNRGASLSSQDEAFEVFTSPYSLGCDAAAELTTVSSVKDLKSCNCAGRLLLLKGEICAEQLMPKEFVFYNPDHHKRIYALLEEKRPAGIITATEKKPEQVGAIYPFPLIVDGDFHIPNGYCKDTVGERVAGRSGDVFRLRIDAERLASTASNVVARKNPAAAERVVIVAHIDAYEHSPGASDNASGTAVLLLLAEMLSAYHGNLGVEIVAFNGEDHYSAAGQMDYLNRYGKEFDGIAVAINIDDVGYKKGNSAYSFYDCPAEIKQRAEETFGDFEGIVAGEQWFNGDHMIFVQNGIGAIAFTAEELSELMATVTHTAEDRPDIINPKKLVDVALALKSLVQQF